MVDHHFAPLFGGICVFPTTLSFREWDTATSKLDSKFRVLKGFQYKPICRDCAIFCQLL